MRVEPAGLSTYDLPLVLRLWLLIHRRKHRIFQHQRIPDVLDKLLAEWASSRCGTWIAGSIQAWSCAFSTGRVIFPS